MSKIIAIIVTMRLNQWIENFFLFAPLIFSSNLFESQLFIKEILAFFSFCLCSSAVYIVKDIIDFKVDSVHPLKASRPITKGILSKDVITFLKKINGEGKTIFSTPDIIYNTDESLLTNCSVANFAKKEYLNARAFILGMQEIKPYCIVYSVSSNTVQQYRNVFNKKEILDF